MSQYQGVRKWSKSLWSHACHSHVLCQ